MFCCSSPKSAQLVMILQLHCVSLQTLKEYLHNVNLSLNSWLYCLLSCIVHDIYISIESMFPLAKSVYSGRADHDGNQGIYGSCTEVSYKTFIMILPIYHNLLDYYSACKHVIMHALH